MTDHLAENEQHALSLARSAIANLNAPPHPAAAAAAGAAGPPWAAAGTSGGGGGGGWEEPRFSPDQLRGACEGLRVVRRLSRAALEARAAAGKPRLPPEPTPPAPRRVKGRRRRVDCWAPGAEERRVPARLWSCCCPCGRRRGPGGPPAAL